MLKTHCVEKVCPLSHKLCIEFDPLSSLHSFIYCISFKSCDPVFPKSIASFSGIFICPYFNPWLYLLMTHFFCPHTYINMSLGLEGWDTNPLISSKNTSFKVMITLRYYPYQDIFTICLVGKSIRERWHELKKGLFSAPISVPYVVNRSVLALKTGPF